MTSIDLKVSDAISYMKTIRSHTVDMILTDPPYNINLSSREPAGFTGIYNDDDNERTSSNWDELTFQASEFIKETERLITNNGCLVLFFDVWKITTIKDLLDAHGFNNIRLLTWRKNNPSPFTAGHGHYLPSVNEYMIFAMKKRKTTPDYKEHHIGIFEYDKPNRKTRKIYSYAQKPIALFEELIERHTKEGEYVLDPYVGSGTTLLACKNTNRSFLGCDILSEHVDNIRQLLKEVR